MFQAPDILSIAYKQPIMHGQLELIQEKEQQIPGSVQYNFKRYKRGNQWNMEDVGMVVYNYRRSDEANNFMELKFCISGNVYCNSREIECDHCKLKATVSCNERVETVDVFSFRFYPTILSQYVKPKKEDSSLVNEVLDFRHPSSFAKVLSLCSKTRSVLDAIINHSYSGSLENIYINAQIQMLLLHSMDCMIGEKEVDGFQCKFLANEQDREKIIKAREVLIQHIGEPITIKELSRKVAINECYLKKGFKELYGSTIFDFYQGQRMEHARYLLYEKGLSVTDVSLMLGYSSISHFSTAFKKHTGIKPCELLFNGK